MNLGLYTFSDFDLQMSLGFPEPDNRAIRNPDHYYFMDGHARPDSNRIQIPYYAAAAADLTPGTPRRLLPAATYLAVLLCLTASLLILPLILPPLPPPPLMLLLLLPIGILGMLMVLAFMPSNDAKNIGSSSHTYM